LDESNIIFKNVEIFTRKNFKEQNFVKEKYEILKNILFVKMKIPKANQLFNRHVLKFGKATSPGQ